MDVLSEIKSKIGRVPDGYGRIGLEAVVLHIETAEKYYIRAKNENDDNLFTDVIYRTNHAYEGILSEAYVILAGQQKSDINSYEIERYFSANNVFNTRVIGLFSNYRKEWRNISTHDHKLFFTGQEAFLAIVSVSAFVNILLDQIIENINILIERQRVEERVQRIMAKIKQYDSLTLDNKLIKLLIAFYHEETDADLVSTESELIGKLIGFLVTVDPGLTVESNVMVEAERGPYRLDLLASLGEEKVIIEVKRIGSAFFDLIRFEQQVFSYLYTTEIERGIIFVYRPGTKNVKSWTQRDFGLLGKQYSVTTIAPTDSR